MKYCSIACRNKLAYKKRRTISCRFCGELTTNYWGNNMCNKCAKMRTKYGLSVENITKLYPYIQKKQCQICLEIKKDKNRRAVNIDHDHETGEVRGIVCNICNVLLSHYEKLRKTVSSDSYWPFLEDYLKNPPAQKIIKENPILHKKSPVK